MSDKGMAIRQENPHVINHIEKRMAKPAKEGKWKRRALALKDLAVDAKNIVTETKVGKGVAAAALAVALSQTPVGKDVTQRVVTGVEGAAGAVTEWLTGPHLENNPWATQAFERIRTNTPGENERFAKKAVTTSVDPSKTRVDVYPLNANFYEGTPVAPIGTIPVGTELHNVLITPAQVYHLGTNRYDLDPNDRRVTGYVSTESWAATDCDSVSSVFLDRQGNRVDNLSQSFPVCVIPEANISLGK